MDLVEKIKNRQAKIAVIGLGYVGLPLALEFAKVNFLVTGIDIDETKTKLLMEGKSYILDVHDQEVQEVIEKGKFKATTDYSVLKDMDCISICVPTPLGKSKDPDISYIVSSVDQIVKYFHKDQLIVLESTTYPGTTEEIILPRLEEKGYKVGEDFYLAFSPERVDPGNPIYKTKNTPKIIGGITKKCTEVTSLLYGTAIEKIIKVSSATSAEMVKLLENTFRAINIGLANETAIMANKLGLDVWEIIDAASSKPFGFMPFYPGPGLGGHCIPIDPLYLSWKLKSLNYNARFIELAGEINSQMPTYVVYKVIDLLNYFKKSVNGSKILVLGVAYKRDISDIRESPALDVIELLIERGGEIYYNDPFVPQIKLKKHKFHSVELTEEFLSNLDCVVITTDHSVYDYSFIVKHAKGIVDTRNATKNVKIKGAKILKI